MQETIEHNRVGFDTDRPTAGVGAVSEAVARLQGGIEKLAIHIDELRSRVGLALRPEDGTVLADGVPEPERRSPSRLALDIETCADQVRRLQYAVSDIHDRVDL